jgi:hypothetical protein
MEEKTHLQEIKRKIQEIEKKLYELKEMGSGIPVIEKNARCMLSFTHTLKFGITDVYDLRKDQEVKHE